MNQSNLISWTPLKLQSQLQEKIWGGDGLYRILKKGNSQDTNMGEAWELSDRQGWESKVQEGAFQGRDLKSLLQEFPEAILGTPSGSNFSKITFPLLYKFIYAREALSVQVHPGDNSPLGEAKTEAWYIVYAPPSAKLIVGLKPGYTPEETVRILQSKDCEKVLQQVEVKAGDMLFIPAGTVHAITAGLLIYEVQQNSDTTFRLYDWGRVDAQGKPRDLHVKESAQVIDFTLPNQNKISPLCIEHTTHTENYLVACPYFALIKYSALTKLIVLPFISKFKVLTCMRGHFQLSGFGDIMELKIGDTILIPAICENIFLKAVETGSEIVLSIVPDLENDVYAPLKKAHYSEQQIQALGIF